MNYWASIVFCVRGEEVLILKRSAHSPSYPGLWALAGGKVEPDESGEVAALRELKEETGLAGELDDLEFLGAMFKEDKLFGFWGIKETKGEVQIDFEHDDWRWAHWKDLEKELELQAPEEIWKRFYSFVK